MTTSKSSGVVIILSGPSGAGKSTVCRPLLEKYPELGFSVSCTTRDPRPGEVHGEDYYFLKVDEFRQRIDAGEFLEYAEVHGNYYGTLAPFIAEELSKGRDILLDIDVQGAMQIRELYAQDPQKYGTLAAATVFVFLGPPSFEELERRLRGRNTETEELITRRLANAKGEMDQWHEYDYLIVNDSVELAQRQLESIILATRQRTSLLKNCPPAGYSIEEG